MHNLDASAASSCFLQLAKLCEKRGIFLCAAGVLPRVEWMLRSHRVAFKFDEEVEIKNSMLSNDDGHWKQPVFGKLILFMTLYEVSTYRFFVRFRVLGRQLVLIYRIPFKRHWSFVRGR